MSGKISIELGSVQKTLLLPLWGRAVETQKKKPLLIDTTAVEIIEQLNYDFSTIASNMSIITQLAWIVRCLHIDRVIGQFLQLHPAGTIVNLGCGLDTTFNRVDNGKLVWYDLDLPDVIDLRKKLVPGRERCTAISRSLLDNSWFEQIQHTGAVLFISAGVLYYFDETEMKEFFITLIDAFPGGAIFFDAASPLGVKIANKRVIEAGGMEKSSILKWGIDSAKQIQSWDNRITVVEEYPMFKGMKKSLSLRNKYGTFLSDRMNIMFMVHLKFSGWKKK